MPLLWVWALLLFSKVAVGDICASQRYTDAGECCKVCPPGTRVAVECGKDNTQCVPCEQGVTFSSEEDSPHCVTCARCPRGAPRIETCTVTADTVCDCGPTAYLWREGDNYTIALCAGCSRCSRGQGVAQKCSKHEDTVCEECPAGIAFNEETKLHGKACTPCTQCQPNEVEIRACEPSADAICMDKQLHINTRPVFADGTRAPPAGTSPQPPQAGDPRLTPREEEERGGGGSNILVYVSVLAAVVLGLLLYVAYKCWRSCQQKQALGKARAAAELNNAPEGEKLHSDSGVFLDSHSLQDTQPSKGSKRDSKQDGRLYVNLPPQRKEEVERALAESGPARGAGGWRALAEALGYERERADVFGRGEDPARTLLSDWAQQEGATLGLLCSALARIERPDVVATLTGPAQGVSVV
ncbi:tumor necrosis factor receptor superfamily member 16 [Sardina pilchardus]|uniref:tumor necrosis factor receptor superfamily member 16 n=1 Tax=Sardina pilchardus TaxID=27697 RepID=UPI002E0E5590